MVDRIKSLLETRQLTPTQFADLIGTARPIVSHILSGRNKPSLEVVQRILAALPELSMAWLLNGTGAMYTGFADSPAVTTSAPAPPAAPPASAAPVATAPLPNSAIVPLPVAPLPIPNPTASLAPPSAPQVPAMPSFTVRKSSAVVSRTNSAPIIRRFTPQQSPQQSPRQSPQQVETLQAAPGVPAPAPATAPNNSPQQASAQLPAEPSVAPLPVAQPEAASDDASASLATALFTGTEKPIRRIVIFYRDGSFGDYQPE